MPEALACHQCGVEFMVKPSKRVKFCGRPCMIKALNVRRQQLRVERGEVAKKKHKASYLKQCSVCREGFVTYHQHRKYCSDKCTRKQSSLWFSEYKLNKRGPIDCRTCGESHTKPGVFCSDDCRAEMARAVRKNNRHKRRNRLRDRSECTGKELAQVYIRDNMECQCCGVKCDNGLDCNSDLYPNLDHMIPLAMGGWHGLDNIELLCRKCNMEKHDSAPDWLVKSYA